MSLIYLETEELALLVSMTGRGARKLAQRFHQHPDRTWHGISLVVRKVHGRGGRSGSRYQVLLSSLPLALQEAWKALQSPVETAPSLRDDRNNVGHWRHHIIAPALLHDKGTTARGDAIREIARTTRIGPDGKPIPSPNVRTIQRWIDLFEEEDDINALVPRHRKDKGATKIIISRSAERAIPFPPETWMSIAAQLRRYIDGHWKEDATFKLISGRANIKFRQLIEAAGFKHCHTIPDNALTVPRSFIEKNRRKLQAYATFKKDRKTYEDNRFRTRRSRHGMQPADWVIADVHPVDIVCERDDGSTVHARMLAWLDAGTNRLRFDLVVCEPRTGIRNADLIRSFCNMVADPTWGMPKTLYIDNGSEYRFAEYVEDALQLVGQLRGGDGRKTRVVHAKPYNASAKPIESMFAALEKMLQDIPGHTGGDRMNSKTERVGHRTKAFPGTLARLEEIIRGRVLESEIYAPTRGPFPGRSPRQVYEAAIAAGWQPVAVDLRQILTVFATDQVRTVTKGVISFDGVEWFCDDLAAYFEPKIIVRVPRFWQPQKLALLHIKTRDLVGIAEPRPVYAFDDTAGAELSSRVDKARRAAIAEIGRSTPSINTVAAGLEIASLIPPASIAAPIAHIGISTEAEVTAEALAESSTDRADRQRAEAQKKRRIQSARMEKLALALQGTKP